MWRTEFLDQPQLGKRSMYARANFPGHALTWRRFAFAVTILVAVAALHGNACALEATYHSSAELDDFLKGLARSHPELVRVESAATSLEGRRVWMVEVGRGTDDDRATRPGMLVVAALEGNHLVGTELALALLDHLVSPDEQMEALLDSVTVYVFPRLNPDGAERYFMTPRTEQTSTIGPVDDDRDGLTDEDGPDDLNGDGVITWVRVEDPEGTYIPDEKDGRIMVMAKPEKGQRGAWRYFIEGVDNDRDEQYNEDGTGGVNFNMNFPFEYKFFDPAAGVHQVCEPETRALADFVLAHQNIGLAVSFSTADNLTKTPADGKREGRAAATKVHPDDLPYFKRLGEEYREELGIDKELTGSKTPGSFADWMYFHRGRMSLATKGWGPGIQTALASAEKSGEKKAEEGEGESEGEGDSKKPGEKKDDDDRDIKAEREFVKWLDENYQEGFVGWREIEHPDFPGKKTEVGGFAPFIKTNPPPSLLGDLGKKHAVFLTGLAAKLPKIGFRKIDVKPLGGYMFEIEVHVENNGYLPTVPAHGVATKEVAPTRIELDVPADQIFAGERITRLGPIAGSGGIEKVRYIVHADRRTQITVRAVSALGGTVEQTMVLNR
jgi:hypothetical protein